MRIEQLGALIVTILELAVFVYGLSRFRKVAVYTQIMIYVAGLMFLLDFAQMMMRFVGISPEVNLITLHLVTLIQYTVFTAFFSSVWKGHPRGRWTGISIVLFAVFWLMAKIFFEPFRSYDTISYGVCSVLMVAFSIWCLLELGLDESVDFLKSARFYLSLGILVYFAGGLFYLLLYKDIFTLALELKVIILSYHWMITVIANLVWMKGISCKQNP